MSRPEPGARRIEPHALVRDERHWHTRTSCQNDEVFKVLLLSRMLEIGKQGPIATAPHRYFLDKWMAEGGAQIYVRRELRYSAFKRLGLDTDCPARRPQDQQTVLLNSEALRQESAGMSS